MKARSISTISILLIGFFFPVSPGNPSVVGRASACQSERSSDSSSPGSRRGAAFQAAMPPFLEAFFPTLFVPTRYNRQ